MRVWREMTGYDDQVAALMVELAEVCRKHGLSLSHEDEHGAFCVRRWDESYEQWLFDGRAVIECCTQCQAEWMQGDFHACPGPHGEDVE